MQLWLNRLVDRGGLACLAFRNEPASSPYQAWFDALDAGFERPYGRPDCQSPALGKPALSDSPRGFHTSGFAGFGGTRALLALGAETLGGAPNAVETLVDVAGRVQGAGKELLRWLVLLARHAEAGVGHAQTPLTFLSMQ